MAKKRPQSKGGGTAAKETKKPRPASDLVWHAARRACVTTARLKGRRKTTKLPAGAREESAGREAGARRRRRRDRAIVERLPQKALDEATLKKTVDAALSALTASSTRRRSSTTRRELSRRCTSSAIHLKERRSRPSSQAAPRELAIRPYARHVALALVKRAADSSQRSGKVPRGRGKFRQIAVHAVGRQGRRRAAADGAEAGRYCFETRALRRARRRSPESRNFVRHIGEVEGRRARLFCWVWTPRSQSSATRASRIMRLRTIYYLRGARSPQSAGASRQGPRKRTPTSCPRAARARVRFTSHGGRRQDAQGITKKCWRSRAAPAAMHARATSRSSASWMSSTTRSRRAR